MRAAPGTEPDWENIAEWKPWRPEEVAVLLRNCDIPWCVAGGWALDVWRGAETRPHEDIEIAIPRRYFPAIRDRLSGFRLFTVGDGDVRPLDASGIPSAAKHQNWVLDEKAHAWRMDIFLEPGDADLWVFRRDETIAGPRAHLVAHSRHGIPYLKPEAVLLYKAKAMRAKDDADFAAAGPRMSLDARAWLADALGRAHPGHPWLARL
jgi:hypothetical protein